MTNTCDTVQSIRTGDGTTKQFSFTFTYESQSEVNVSLYNETTKYYVPLANDQWSFVNATTIQFITAPPAQVDESGNPIANIKIWRQTDIESLIASFYPGSAIRAQDLNSNFEQLQHAIQEVRCEISSDVLIVLDDYWDKNTDTLKSTDTWVSSDEKVATSAAINSFVNSALPPAGIPEAPINSKTYGRNNANWVEVTGGGGLIYKGTRDLTLAAPINSSDGDYYVNTATSGVVDSSWTGIDGQALTGSERVAYNGSVWEFLPSSPGDGIDSIVAGNDISVDNSNLANPVVSVTPNSFIPFDISSLGELP